MKLSRTTRSHFTHARSCSRSLNRVSTRAKRPAFTRTYSLWKGDIFPFDRLTGYKKSNQNQIGRVLPFAFLLKCIRIYLLFSSLSDFDSFRWRVNLSYGVSGLPARMQLKTLSSLLKADRGFIRKLEFCKLLRCTWPRWRSVMVFYRPVTFALLSISTYQSWVFFCIRIP